MAHVYYSATLDIVITPCLKKLCKIIFDRTCQIFTNCENFKYKDCNYMRVRKAHY